MVIRGTKRHCTSCKNHGLSVPKKGHQCPYAECPCLLCKLTKKAQTAMRHQQRFWRHQKQKLKIQGIEEGGERSCNFQVCDKCRNHNIIIPKKNHECPYTKCDCEYCSLTFKRREIMKHQQRVRRSKIMSQVESDGTESVEAENIGDDEDEATGNDTDNNSRDSSYDKDDNASSDYLGTREEGSSRSSSAQLLSFEPKANESKEFESLSTQFSSLEADYPLNQTPELEPITGCGRSNTSPPPLLPLEVVKPSSSEDFLSRNHTLSSPSPYEILPSDIHSMESPNDQYRDRKPFSQGFQMVESSQISTLMLLQSERYLSEPSRRSYTTPRHAQGPSGALKLIIDQPRLRPMDIPLPISENRHNHSTIASFSNFTQTPAMILQQSAYESEHLQQLQQRPRQIQRHHQHHYRPQQQRDQEQLYSLPYFNPTHLNS